MALGSDAEALAYEEATYQSLVLRAEAAEELVDAQKHLAKARQYESRAYKILVRKAEYEEEIARLESRSRLFKNRAHEYEMYHKEEGVESFKNAAESRHLKSRTLTRQAKMCEKKIGIIAERVSKILQHAEDHRKLRMEHESEARRLEGEAINVQREV